jgi:hypothetical protein
MVRKKQRVRCSSADKNMVDETSGHTNTLKIRELKAG